MVFEVRNKLMNLVENDATSYEIAIDFVDDDANKLIVFTNAYHAQRHDEGVEQRTAAATLVAQKRWNTMFPPGATLEAK